MTLEQAKALIPNEDYVIVEGEIYKFISMQGSRLQLTNEKSKTLFAFITECHLLGEYRGCFDSSVLPPRAFEDGIQKEYSVDVIMLIEEELLAGYYHHSTGDWVSKCLYDEVFVVDEEEPFNWCFKPDYLKF